MAANVVRRQVCWSWIFKY